MSDKKPEDPRPLGDIVLFLKEERSLASGLVLPENSSENYAIVFAVGPDCKQGLKKGDRLMFWKMEEGDVGAFHWGDTQYGMCKESLIACVLPGEMPAEPMIKESRGNAVILQ